MEGRCRGQGEGAKGVTMGREGGGTVPWTR